VKTFASTLMKCLQEQDIAARMGGGEFAVLLSNSAEHDVDAFLFDLQTRMDALEVSGGKNYHIDYSHGVIEQDEKYTTLRDMLEESGKVMYAEKRRR
jgi:diguanylate cyclase (GGDEF)-like protein